MGMTKVFWGQEIPASAGIEMRNRIINNTSLLPVVSARAISLFKDYDPDESQDLLLY